MNITSREGRRTVIAMIDEHTDYDATTVRFHRDGTISAVKDADKTFNAPETMRLLVCHVGEFAGGRNPFRA